MNRQSLWLRLMLISFVANGLGPFGLRVMTAKGLSEQYHYQYLLWWYAGGLVFALASLVMTRTRLHPREIVMACGIGIGSFGGQLFSLMALEKGIPGYIVFPITTGGNLFIVATAGILLFHERISRYGIAGIVTGVLSLVLLSLG